MTSNSHNVALGRAVATLREANALDIETLAGTSEIAVRELEEIENGEVEARWGELRRISYGLKVPLSQLIALGEKFEDRA